MRFIKHANMIIALVNARYEIILFKYQKITTSENTMPYGKWIIKYIGLKRAKTYV